MLSDERLAEIEALAKAAESENGWWFTMSSIDGGDDGVVIGPISCDAPGPDQVGAMIAELRSLRRIASAAERVVRLRGWTSDAEAHPGRGEAERDLAKLVEEWKK